MEIKVDTVEQWKSEIRHMGDKEALDRLNGGCLTTIESVLAGEMDGEAARDMILSMLDVLIKHGHITPEKENAL